MATSYNVGRVMSAHMDGLRCLEGEPQHLAEPATPLGSDHLKSEKQNMHLPVLRTPEILWGGLWAYVCALAKRMWYCSLFFRKGPCLHVGTHLLWRGD